MDTTASSSGTIMIVDDTPANLALLSDTLSEAGYRVLVATDGLSAIEQIDYLKPDIILMDVVMPGIDGFETCRRLKSDPLTALIPILFMTGLSELDNLLRGFDEGGLDYIVKPIRPPEVLARIEVHLAQARARQRTENALNHCPFYALAVDREGSITWLAPAAKAMFTDFMQHCGLSVGSLLPKPVLDWFHNNRHHAEGSIAEYRAYGGFTISMGTCQNAGEYLLLLKKCCGEWNLESLKDALGLTFREAEILMWISRGKTNKEVGLILESSHRTVNKHLEHIYEKLGVSTRAAAVAMVLQRTGAYN
ncbi:MAG: response regulator transcription factor [Methylovulum sp.]|uniref:response regulator transcription factor n=1 Tax=Methylovulum sp. TaxID=1916980 RepID=UPI002606077B|nr:response regulator transcription factor [Methylovulum sp.]MDD2722869.1 response regulator transcription factor [Methylovulum sp.]